MFSDSEGDVKGTRTELVRNPYELRISAVHLSSPVSCRLPERGEEPAASGASGRRQAEAAANAAKSRDAAGDRGAARPAGGRSQQGECPDSAPSTPDSVLSVTSSSEGASWQGPPEGEEEEVVEGEGEEGEEDLLFSLWVQVHGTNLSGLCLLRGRSPNL